jgi:uncharacterized RDD family membrane protein YckC
MEWYYRSSGNQHGPLTEADFGELAADGRIYADTLVWRTGMAEWVQFRQLTEADRPVVTETCEHCHGQFATTRMLTITDRRVCYRCKPYYVQEVKEVGFVRKRQGIPFMPRALAAVLDTMFISVLMGLLGGAGGFVSTFMGFALGGGVAMTVFVVSVVLTCLAPIVYLTVTVGWLAATPGKKIMGLKVVMNDGGKVSYRRALMRSLGAALSPALLFLPWLVAAFDEHGLAMHDRLCNTKVVKA